MNATQLNFSPNVCKVELPLAATDARAGLVTSVGVGMHGVWIVTRRFGVYFRVGVTANKLEGKEWLTVPTPPMARE